MSVERLRELFRLEPGGALVWRVTNSNRAVAGSRAGWLRDDGYMEVRADGERLRYHHVVFALHHGRLPVGFVDHRDRDHTNNDPSNLREATPLQSSWNRDPAGGRNKSGATGVVWDRTRGKWAVRVMARGKNYSFGRWSDFEFAELVAQEARRKLHGEFALLRT